MTAVSQLSTQCCCSWPPRIPEWFVSKGTSKLILSHPSDPIPLHWQEAELVPAEDKCLSQGFAGGFGHLGLKYSWQRMKKSPAEVSSGQPFPSSWVSWILPGSCLKCLD